MPADKPVFSFLRDGAMAARVQAFDWAGTPLGDPAGWPPELVTAVSFVLETHIPAALVWGPDFVTVYNDAFRPILGDKPDALGRSFRDFWAEAWDEIAPIVERAYAGDATFIEDFPLVIDRSGHSEQAYFTFCYSPVRNAAGQVVGMIDTVIETTAAVNARERSVFVNRELGHRLKNTMAMAHAIGQQSFRDLVDRRPLDAFSDRIVALGTANDVLLQSNWESAPISGVVAGVLASLGYAERTRVTGDDRSIGPKAVLSLAMLLHEMATNAVKYGALSTDGGMIDISWRSEEEDFVLSWRETGGPEVVAPSRSGFGSRIINLGLLGTRKSAVRYVSTGLEADFYVPIHRLVES